MTAVGVYELRRLTVTEAAEYARKGVKSVREALGNGDLHGRQFTAPGGRWTIRRECLDAWLDGERCPHGKGQAA